MVDERRRGSASAMRVMPAVAQEGWYRSGDSGDIIKGDSYDRKNIKLEN